MRHLENQKPVDYSSLDSMKGNAMSLDQQRKVMGGTDSGGSTGTIDQNSDIDID